MPRGVDVASARTPPLTMTCLIKAMGLSKGEGHVRGGEFVGFAPLQPKKSGWLSPRVPLNPTPKGHELTTAPLVV